MIEDALAASTVLGRYTLLEKIGRGGFGVVYRAKDPLLDRPVAAKLLRSRRTADGLGDSEALIQEARLTAQLQHPNVVRIFDVGRVEGLSPARGADVFIIMELLHGRPLHRWIKTDERTPQEIVRVYLQAAEGLAAAHLAGIVHCDFKPANVFVARDGTAKVLDFGLALHTSKQIYTTKSGPVEAAVATPPPSRPLGGTPMYMPPEAHDGRALNFAADQYSFAVSLIESLAGVHPFGRKDRHTLARMSLKGISTKWLKERDVPRGLIRILKRATNPIPHLRYPGMDTLALALRQWIDPPTIRRVLSGSLVAASGALVAVWAIQPDAECQPPEGAAAAAWADAKVAVEERWTRSALPYASAGQAKFHEQIDTFVTAWTEAARTVCAPDFSPPSRAEAGQACLRERLGRLQAVLDTVSTSEDRVLLRAHRLAAQLLEPTECLDPHRQSELPPTPRDPRDRIEVESIRDLLAAARAQLAAGNLEDGLELARHGLQRASAVGFEPVEAEAMYEYGLLAVSAGDLEGGAENMEQAYLRAAGLRHDRLAAATAVRLVSVHGRFLMNEELARQWARRAESTFDRLEDTTLHRAALQYNLGLLEHAHGDLDLAEHLFREALELFEREEDAQNAAIIKLSLGVIANSDGRPQEALALFEEVYAIHRAELGLDHPDTATALSSVAGAQSSLDQLLVALENFATAKDVLERSFGSEHHAVASAYLNVGVVELELGRYEASLDNHVRALELFEATLPPSHPRTATAVENVARLNLLLGDAEKARAGHARALEMRRKQLKPGNSLLALSHANLGLALAHLGRSDEVQAQFDAALSVLRDGGGDEESRGAVIFKRAKAKLAMNMVPIDDLRRSIDLLGVGVPVVQRSEAKFELAKLLDAEQRAEALTLANEARVHFLSIGAVERAAPIDVWLKSVSGKR